MKDELLHAKVSSTRVVLVKCQHRSLHLREMVGCTPLGGSPPLSVARLPAKSPPSSQELGSKGGPPWQFRGPVHTC